MFEKFGKEWRKTEGDWMWPTWKSTPNASGVLRQPNGYTLYWGFYMSRSGIDLCFVSVNMENICIIELILLLIEFNIYLYYFFIKLCHFSFSRISFLLIKSAYGYKTAENNPNF